MQNEYKSKNELCFIAKSNQNFESSTKNTNILTSNAVPVCKNASSALKACRKIQKWKMSIKNASW
jgi:hypothetical protein